MLKTKNSRPAQGRESRRFPWYHPIDGICRHSIEHKHARAVVTGSGPGLAYLPTFDRNGSAWQIAILNDPKNLGVRPATTEGFSRGRSVSSSHRTRTR